MDIKATEHSNFRLAWKKALHLWPDVFRRAWAWLFFALIAEEITSLGVSSLKQVDEKLMFSGILLVIGVKLFLDALLMIVINQIIWDTERKTKTDLFLSLSRNIKYVFIESTRAIVPVLLKLLLLVIPGLIEAVRLYFVPFIAQFDSEYRHGKVDALERSRDLTKHHFWNLTLMLILTLVLDMVPDLWLGSLQIMRSPFQYVMAFFIVLVVTAYTDSVLFCVFIQLEDARGKQNGNPISVAGPTQS